MPHRLAQWPLKLLVATAAGVMLLLLPKAAWAFRPTGAGASASTPRSSSPSSSLSSPQSRASIIRRAGGGQAQSQAQAQQQQPQGPLTRRSMLTVGHDAAVQTALPLLFGRWTLKENRVPKTLWGRSKGTQGAPMDPVKLSYEVELLPKGRLEQPLESSLRGLDWKLSFKDIYSTGRLDFKIVHPPPDQKLVANDQIPSIHYYSGTFCEGLDKVEGWVERYADIDDEALGPIRKRVRIGRFSMRKNGGISLAPSGPEQQQQQQIRV